jgi:hypothetical protein
MSKAAKEIKTPCAVPEGNFCMAFFYSESAPDQRNRKSPNISPVRILLAQVDRRPSPDIILLGLVHRLLSLGRGRHRCEERGDAKVSGRRWCQRALSHSDPADGYRRLPSALKTKHYIASSSALETTIGDLVVGSLIRQNQWQGGLVASAAAAVHVAFLLHLKGNWRNPGREVRCAAGARGCGRAGHPAAGSLVARPWPSPPRGWVCGRTRWGDARLRFSLSCRVAVRRTVGLHRRCCLIFRWWSIALSKSYVLITCFKWKHWDRKVILSLIVGGYIYQPNRRL